MTTRTIGVKEFRQNMAKLYKKGRKGKVFFLVMNHQKPVMRVEMLDEDHMILEKFLPQIERGLADYKKGKFYTADQIGKEIRQRKR